MSVHPTYFDLATPLPVRRIYAGSSVIAKFHYTDTDTDFVAAKLRWVRAGPFRRKKSASVSV